MIAVSTRALMATLAIGVTLPSDSMRTGTCLALGGGDIDRHHAGAPPCERAAAVGGPESADEQGNANQGERRHPK